MLDPIHRYRTILLFGMPGSGKGTQGAILGQLPDLVHVSCGDIFRKLSKFGALGKEVLYYTSRGLLVPDELTVKIWQRHIRILEMQEYLIPDYHILVLDGLPRNLFQARMIDKLLDVVQIFHLVINDMDKTMERLKSRALRENRLDDVNEDVINRRIQTYHDETEQTLQFYKKSLVCEVDAAQTPIDVLRSIVVRLSDLSHQRNKPPTIFNEDMVQSGV